MKNVGVLPYQRLNDLLVPPFVVGITANFVNPASIDLPITDEAYRLDSIFLPQRGEMVRTLMQKVGAKRHDLSQPFEVGVPYLIRLAGRWQLPNSVFAYANPKSTTGRLNFFCRLIADGSDMYDTLPKNWGNGGDAEMWLLVRADSFPILVYPGLALSQLRLFSGTSFLDDLEVQMAMRKFGLIFDPGKRKIPYNEVMRHSDSFYLTLMCEGVIGWECRGSNRVLDMAKDKIGTYDPRDYFTLIEARHGEAHLKKGSFYILTTRERVMVPPPFSAELRPIDPRLGEVRVHAAGYIDCGWGYGKAGEACGRPITLEVTPHEDMLMRNEQKIARIRFEKMHEVSDKLYDDAASNYKEQEIARLAKYFKAAA